MSERRQGSPDYSRDPDLTRAYRKAFMPRRGAPVVLNDLMTTFRFLDKDHYEDPGLQARVLGQRDVILEILGKCGALDDPMEVARAFSNVYAKPPEEMPRQAELGLDDLDLREQEDDV